VALFGRIATRDVEDIESEADAWQARQPQEGEKRGPASLTRSSISAACQPHQFRTRNGANELKQTRTKSNETATKSA
jgi:hypothetical protein